MQYAMNVRQTLYADRATTEDALELFDSLESVDVDFMIGNWKGEGAFLKWAAIDLGGAICSGSVD